MNPRRLEALRNKMLDKIRHFPSTIHHPTDFDWIELLEILIDDEPAELSNWSA